jgi:hypothetical protein
MQDDGEGRYWHAERPNRGGEKDAHHDTNEVGFSGARMATPAFVPPSGGPGHGGEHAYEGGSNPQNRLLLETLLALHHKGGPPGAPGPHAGGMHSPASTPAMACNNWGSSAVGWGSMPHGIGLPGLPESLLTMHGPVFPGGGMSPLGPGDLPAPRSAAAVGSRFARIDGVRKAAIAFSVWKIR